MAANRIKSLQMWEFILCLWSCQKHVGVFQCKELSGTFFTAFEWLHMSTSFVFFFVAKIDSSVCPFQYCHFADSTLISFDSILPNWLNENVMLLGTRPNFFFLPFKSDRSFNNHDAYCHIVYASRYYVCFTIRTIVRPKWPAEKIAGDMDFINIFVFIEVFTQLSCRCFENSILFSRNEISENRTSMCHMAAVKI